MMPNNWLIASSALINSRLILLILYVISRRASDDVSLFPFSIIVSVLWHISCVFPWRLSQSFVFDRGIPEVGDIKFSMQRRQIANFHRASVCYSCSIFSKYIPDSCSNRCTSYCSTGSSFTLRTRMTVIVLEGTVSRFFFLLITILYSKLYVAVVRSNGPTATSARARWVATAWLAPP